MNAELPTTKPTHTEPVIRKRLVGVVVVVQGKGKLPDLVRALHPASRFTSRLNGRKQKGDQNPDDRNNDEEFDQCKGFYITPPLILTFSCVLDIKSFLLTCVIETKK